jgi:hypothetical protein
MKIIIIIALFLISVPAFATEPDTIWTQGANFKSWFTPDGSRIVTQASECLDVLDGHVIWNEGGTPNGKFTKDSLYFYSSAYQKFKISDGKNLDTEYVSPKFKTLPPVFKDTVGHWWIPREGSLRIGDDDNTFFFTYVQYYFNDYTQKKEAAIALMCKYDRALDSIVAYKPILINGDTLVLYDPYYEIIGYSQASNSILLGFLKSHLFTFRQINASTMDSVCEFGYDEDKWGAVRDMKISYTGKYFGFVTTMGESNLGWINIYDLTTNSLYKRFLDGDSSTSDGFGCIAFSRNDSFLVTSGGKPLQIKTWNLHTGALIHSYENRYSAAYSLDVSPDNTKIIVPGGLTTLLRARWTPVTSVDEEKSDIEAMILYPNPGNDFIEISYPPLERGSGGVGIKIYNIFGQIQTTPVYSSATPASGGQVRINVSGLAAGMYFVRIGDRVGKFLKI